VLSCFEPDRRGVKVRRRFIPMLRKAHSEPASAGRGRRSRARTDGAGVATGRASFEITPSALVAGRRVRAFPSKGAIWRNSEPRYRMRLHSAFSRCDQSQLQYSTMRRHSVSALAQERGPRSRCAQPTSPPCGDRDRHSIAISIEQTRAPSQSI